MTTLTISSFTRAINGIKGTNVATAMPPSAPVVPAMAQVHAKHDTQANKDIDTQKIDVPNPVTITSVKTLVQDYDMATKEELLEKARKAREKADAAEKELEDFKASERGDVLARIRAEMLDYGIDASELSARSNVEKRSGKGLKRGPAPIKYKNAATGDAWSGRGQKPLWLKAAIANGKKIEDFAV